MKKDKKELGEFESNNKKNKAEYNIIIVQKQGGSVKIIKRFPAFRWRAEDDVVYLRNDSKSIKFLELVPQQLNNIRNFTEREVNELLKKKEEILKEERLLDTSAINDKDVEFEIMQLKAKLRSFKYSPNSSYEFLDENNVPTYIFLREGSNFLPYKWDSDTKTIFMPSDNRKKSASLSLRNKEQKYNIQKLLTGSLIGLFIIGLLLAATGGFFWWSAYQSQSEFMDLYDNSNIARAQRSGIESLQVCQDVSVETSKETLKLIKALNDKIVINQTIIEGVIPE